MTDAEFLQAFQHAKCVMLAGDLVTGIQLARAVISAAADGLQTELAVKLQHLAELLDLEKRLANSVSSAEFLDRSRFSGT